MAESASLAERNKALVRAAFERWRNGTGSPFELLDEDTTWTIVGSSPLSKTYPSRQEFIDQVLRPINACLSAPLIPTVRGIYADGDTVITLFDAAGTAKDGIPYRNTYTWFFQFQGDKVVKAVAFLDTRDLDALWTRVQPTA